MKNNLVLSREELCELSNNIKFSFHANQRLQSRFKKLKNFDLRKSIANSNFACFSDDKANIVFVTINGLGYAVVDIETLALVTVVKGAAAFGARVVRKMAV